VKALVLEKAVAMRAIESFMVRVYIDLFLGVVGKVVIGNNKWDFSC